MIDPRLDPDSLFFKMEQHALLRRGVLKFLRHATVETKSERIIRATREVKELCLTGELRGASVIDPAPPLYDEGGNLKPSWLNEKDLHRAGLSPPHKEEES
jgi:hypothetical protein